MSLVLGRDDSLKFSVSLDDAIKCVGNIQTIAIYLSDVAIGVIPTDTEDQKMSEPKECTYYDTFMDNTEGENKQYIVQSKAQVYPAYYIVLRRSDNEERYINRMKSLKENH